MRRALLALALLFTAAAAAAPPRVVVTIPPLHALTAGVMEGIARPELLLPSGSSPHDYALLPSDARALAEADLVVWVGEPLERFLVKPLRTLAGDAERLTAAELPEVRRLEPRRDEDWQHHDHGDAHDHAQEVVDPHLWLDPRNAAAIVAALAERLSALDPEHAERYRANAERLERRLAELDAENRERLAAVRGAPYVVFHDAYHYFEHRYGLNAVGAVTVSPERSPGARHLSEIRARIEKLDARCVFREPQFTPSLAETVIRGTDAKLAVLDPMGAKLEPGPEAYFELIENLREDLIDCLGR